MGWCVTLTQIIIKWCFILSLLQVFMNVIGNKIPWKCQCLSEFSNEFVKKSTPETVLFIFQSTMNSYLFTCTYKEALDDQ